MGCCQSSSGVYGPVTKMDLNDIPERDSDEETLLENEFPYMSGRLREIDWHSIVEAGEPWKDPTFPHGPECLFMNHKGPAKEENLSK